ncbi:GL27115 [Drosophila persimilis]|uniref:GL27115 n=1 Tax=Drosophila persimilis TaxID=7234 RepID=B4IRL5_DROPE|nr:GL27115 [Drosophila persimilis]
MNSLPRNGAHLGHLQAGEGMDVLDDRGRSKKFLWHPEEAAQPLQDTHPLCRSAQ